MNETEKQNKRALCGICGESHKPSECDTAPLKTHIPDAVIPSKARLTLPPNFSVIAMADGTRSIITKTFIEKGTHFGPLEAQRLLTLNPDILFPLKLFTEDVENLSEYYLNTCDENTCNWMIFIAHAQNSDEQNLMCFQEKSKIYFVTTKDVQEGEFLKVWYSPYYAKLMNRDVLKPYDLPEFHFVVQNVPEPIDLNKLVKKQQKIVGRDRWNCKFCGKDESDVSVFTDHIKNHYRNKVRKPCNVCKESFRTLRELRRHMKVNHGINNEKKSKIEMVVSPEEPKTNEVIVGGPLLNNLVIDSFDNTALVLPCLELNQLGLSLNNSMETQPVLLEGDSLSLNMENLLSENVKELDHFNFEIGERQEEYRCDVCLKAFMKLPNLMQHLTKHTGKYTCPHCLKVFCRSENLNAHVCNDTKQANFGCELCQRTFTLRKYLVRHMTAIHDKKFRCENCNKQYHSEKEHREHNCAAIPDEFKQTFTCSTCNKKFLRELYLKKHLKVHSQRNKQEMPAKSLICEVCARSFHSKKGLKAHMDGHADPTLSCEVCGKKFHRRTTLAIHMATHKDSTVSCDICDVKLKNKSSLAVHMRQHEEVRPYKCNSCPLSFHQRSNLMKHYKRKHTLTCCVCKVTFASDELLQKHSVEHAVTELLTCPLCEVIIKLRSSLRRHLKHKHPSADAEAIMAKVKSTPVNLKENPDLCNNNLEADDINVDLMNCELNVSLEGDNFDSIVDSFDKIMSNYVSDNTDNLGLSNYEKSDNTAEKILDFNSLQIDLDSNLGVQQNTNENREVCLSMPDLTEPDQDITFGDSAYMLDNRTMFEAKDQENMFVYMLDKNL